MIEIFQLSTKYRPKKSLQIQHIIVILNLILVLTNAASLRDQTLHDSINLNRSLNKFIENKKHLSQQSTPIPTSSLSNTKPKIKQISSTTVDYDNYEYQEIYDQNPQDYDKENQQYNEADYKEDSDSEDVTSSTKPMILSAKNDTSKPIIKTTSSVSSSLRKQELDELDYSANENEETGEEDYYQLSNSQLPTLSKINQTSTLVTESTIAAVITSTTTKLPISVTTTKTSTEEYDYDDLEMEAESTKKVSLPSKSNMTNSPGDEDYKDYLEEEDLATEIKSKLDRKLASKTAQTGLNSTIAAVVQNSTLDLNSDYYDLNDEDYDAKLNETEYYEDEYNNEEYIEEDEPLDENYDDIDADVKEDDPVLVEDESETYYDMKPSMTAPAPISTENENTQTSTSTSTIETTQSTWTATSTLTLTTSTLMEERTDKKPEENQINNYEIESDVDVEDDDDEDVADEIDEDDDDYDDLDIKNAIEILKSNSNKKGVVFTTTNTTGILNHFSLKELIKSPALLAGIFGGLLVGVITALLLLFFIIYRMRRTKCDESYIINGKTLKNSSLHYGNPSSRHFNRPRAQHVTLLSSSSLSPVANLSAGSSSSSASSASSATTGLLNGTASTNSRLLKFANHTNSLKKTCSILSTDSASSPNHDGSFNYAYIKAPTKEFYA